MALVHDKNIKQGTSRLLFTKELGQNQKKEHDNLKDTLQFQTLKQFHTRMTT